MPIQKSTNMKFSDLNTNILGVGSTSSLSLSALTNSSTYSMYGGVYPPSATVKTNLSDYFSTLSGTVGTFLTDGTNNGCLFGKSVAISKDGTTMAVGVGVRPINYDYLMNDCAVHIYIKSGSTWTLQQVLVATTAVSNATAIRSLGMAGLALSSDGNTLVAGAPNSGGYQFSSAGTVVVFTRSGTTWTQQGTPIYSSDIYYVFGPKQGFSVDVSDDGNTLAFGGPENTNSSDYKSEGGVWVYTRSGSTWTVQGSRLYGTGSNTTGNGPKQGYSVALSSDGNTLAVGGNGDNAYTGAVWIFTRSGTTWSQQGSKITATNQLGTSTWSGGSNENNGGFGCSVSLSSDGNTLVVGAYGDNTNIGAVWVYTRSGATWSLQGSKMIPSGYIGTPKIGYVVSLSPDGNTLYVGAPFDNSSLGGLGAIWVYTRSGSTWTQQTKITSSKTNINFGQSISSKNTSTFVTSTKDGISADSRTISGLGSIFTFTGSAASWIEGLSKYTPTNPSITPGNGNFGSSSDLSADGNTLAVTVGGSQSTASTTAAAQGAVFIYGRVNNTWVKQAVLADYTNAAGAIYNGTPLCVLGSGVVLSADGTTCAVGCSQDWPNTSTQYTVGSIFVFTRPNSTSTTWTFQQRLIPTGYTSNSPQMTNGYNALVMSADGNTIAAGASNDGNVGGNATGSTYIFVRSGTTWSQQTRLVGTGIVGSTSQQGYAISLSNDGNTLAVGGYLDNSYATGAVWIFTRSGTTWSQQAKLTPTGSVGSQIYFGKCVRLSIDGNSLIVGADGDNNYTGAFYAFTRSGSTWTQRIRVVPSGESGSNAFGTGLALSADAKTLLLGGPDAGASGVSGIGAAYIFTRSGDHTTWTQGSKLDFSSHSFAYSNYRFGHSILISKTGKIVYVNGRDYLNQYNGLAGVLVPIT